MTSFPTTRPFARSFLASPWLCLALASCAAQHDTRDEVAAAFEPALASYAVPDSTSNASGPNVDFDSAGFEFASAAPGASPAAPQAGLFATGWSFNAGLGYVCAESPTGDDSSYSVDEMDWSYHAAVGYRFFRYLGVEAGYVNLGKETYDLDAGLDDGEVETDGFHLSAIGYYPIYSIFDAIARVGVFRWEETEENDSGAGTVTTHDDGADLFYGIGVQASIVGHWAARLEWAHLDKSGSDSTDFDNWMLSLIWIL